MLNPLFDSEREHLLGQIDDLKDEVKQLAREKAALEQRNRELQDKVNLCKSNIVIVDDKKIDVIKVLHAMCKAELFKMKDGSKFTIKAIPIFLSGLHKLLRFIVSVSQIDSILVRLSDFVFEVKRLFLLFVVNQTTIFY
jgi:hypothetical protein